TGARGVSAARALLRPHRIEIVSCSVLAVVMVAIGVGTWLRMNTFGIPDACFIPDAPAQCAVFRPGPMEAYYEALRTLGPAAFVAALAIPVISAVVLGLALVARELEQQTTVLAWSLSPSRIRWLGQRILLLGAGLVLIGLVAGEV